MIMHKIIVKEVPGELEDFLEFMEDKSDTQKYRDKLQVEPEFKVDDNTLGAELTGVILTDVNVVVPLISQWVENRNIKTTKDKIPEKFFINITYYDNDGNEMYNSGENMTLGQILNACENLAPNSKLELGLKIKKVNFEASQEHINSVTKILFIASNPLTTSRLRLDEEVREIEEGLLRAKYRGQFELHSRLAVRPKDIRRALLDYGPHIVHFSGHGKKGALLVEDEGGSTAAVSSKALSGLFELFSGQVECVLLNSCYSAEQATDISKHINYVVGMQKKIKDKAAIEFAVGFYDALGAGKSVEQAFRFGCNAILQVFPTLSQHLIPVLKKKSGLKNNTIGGCE
jgi:hypothetical protein